MGRSTWALLDQGLFAVSNFALNIVLARWLGADAYGAFAIAFTVFLFVGVVHSSLLTEPMLVFGSGRYRDSLSGYFSSLLKLHWTWGWLLAAGLTAVAAIPFWGGPSREAILVLAALTGLLLYQWLLRRACYLETRPRFAAEGGALYLLLMLGGIAGLHQAERLSAVGGLLVMGGASLIAGMFLQHRLARARVFSDGASPDRAEILRQHWSYGSWALLTGILGWVPGNIAMLVLPIWGGTAASGELRAATNLILPVQQLLAAAGPLLLPLLVRSRDHPQFKRRVLGLATVFMIAPLVWALFLGTFGSGLSLWLYDGGFEISSVVLLLLGVQATVAAGVLVAATGLRAMEQPSLVSRGYATACVLSLGVAIPLTASHGVEGAALGGVIAVLGNAAVMLHALRHAKLTQMP